MSSAPVPFGEALRVWARVALMSFGGPAGQIAVMHRELVEQRRWVSEQQFLHALNFCMLLPGPEAQQLATYLGWLKNGIRGGIAAGALFILPGAVAILLLSFVYVAAGDAPAIEALFFGLKAAVLAIVVDAVLRIGRRALTSGTARLIAGIGFLAIFFFAVPFPLIILAAALAGLFLTRRGGGDGDGDMAEPPVSAAARRASHRAAFAFLLLWLAPVAALLLLLGRGDVFTEIALFFSRMAVVTFGGAYAVLAYVAQQAVDHFGWVSPEEMLDGLGLAETTPGPLIMVTQFVGFLAAFRESTGLPPYLAGALGALLTTWVTFAPCFLWIFLGAPYLERLRHNRSLSRALSAITAAVVGVILNLAVWFAVHFLFGRVERVAAGPFDFDSPVPASIDWSAALLSAAAAFAILRLKLSPMLVLAACAMAGAAFRLIVAGGS